ncbi:MAG: hypothetical protein LWY06_14865 [Firmicutes bacterium]|nr:hypothetical protein [Bacillota bacterium]
MKFLLKFLFAALILISFAQSVSGKEHDYYFFIRQEKNCFHTQDPVEFRISFYPVGQPSVKTLKKTFVINIYQVESENLIKEDKAEKMGKLVRTVQYGAHYEESKNLINQKDLIIKDLAPGLYAIQAQNEDRPPLFFTVSDLGLTVEKDKSKIIVFVQDNKTGSPVEEADVVLCANPSLPPKTQKPSSHA